MNPDFSFELNGSTWYVYEVGYVSEHSPGNLPKLRHIDCIPDDVYKMLCIVGRDKGYNIFSLPE